MQDAAAVSRAGAVLHLAAHDPAVSRASADAMAAVDLLLADRRLRSVAAGQVEDVRRMAGLAGAELDGATGSEDDSPMGRMIAASCALVRECVALVSVAERAPAQALARCHVVATAWADQPEDERGRPRTGDTADDPLHLGSLPLADEARQSLTSVLALMRRHDIPGLHLAALCHGEIAWSRPFALGSMAVARAAGRLVLAVRGVDPDGLVPVEAGVLSIGRARYARALRDFGAGDVAPWLLCHAEAVRVAAGLAHDALLGAPDVD